MWRLLAHLFIVLMAIYSSALLDKSLEAKVDHFITFYALCGPLHLYLGGGAMIEEACCSAYAIFGGGFTSST